MPKAAKSQLAASALPMSSPKQRSGFPAYTFFIALLMSVILLQSSLLYSVLSSSQPHDNTGMRASSEHVGDKEVKPENKPAAVLETAAAKPESNPEAVPETSVVQEYNDIDVKLSEQIYTAQQDPFAGQKRKLRAEPRMPKVISGATFDEVQRLHELVNEQGVLALRQAPGSVKGFGAAAAASLPKDTTPAHPAEVECFNSYNCTDYDKTFVKEAADFTINADVSIAALLKAQNYKAKIMRAYELEYIHKDYTHKVTPTNTYHVIENKWNIWSAARNSGLPVMPLIYAATDPAYSHPQVPVYNREALMEAVAAMPSKDFVVKPMSCKESIGVHIFSHSKWVNEKWTLETLANLIENYFTPAFATQCWDEFQHQQESKYDFDTPRTAPGGFMIMERHKLSDNEDCAMSSSVHDCHRGGGRCRNRECIPLELRVYVVWGKAYIAACYGSPGCGDKNGPYMISPTQGLRKWSTNRREKIGINPLWSKGSERYEQIMRMQHATDCAMSVHLPEIRKYSELVAKRLGFEFLRADWFVGGLQGLRLNELAPFPYSTTGGHSLGILQTILQGYRNKKYKTRQASSFLGPLGCKIVDNTTQPVICRALANPPVLKL